MRFYNGAVAFLSPILVLGAAASSASPCLTKNDCAEGEYCADIVQQCLPIGGCVEELDCNNPENQPYAVAMCMGTLDCEEGTCVMNCGGIDDPSPSSSSFCAADTDCLEGQYCAQGECLTNGMCKSDADCFNPNHLFADVMCIGYQYCDANDGYCKRQCGEQCPFGKEAEECSVTGCDTRIRIPGAVSCAPDFCDDCKGIYFDAAGFVITGWENTSDGDQSPEEENAGSDDAASKSESALPTVNCESEDDCSENEYCASEGVCLTIGNCNENSDCLDDDNQPFAVALCMGTLECQQGVCAMNCGADDGTAVEEINNDATATANSCASKDDCGPSEYCAQGTCLRSGMCESDSDCKNPDHIFADVMCIGYQYCDATDGYCKRECGEQCPPGKQAAECSVSGCDTRIRIPGSVSCAPDYCDDCKGIHYDAAGNVITGWENTSDGNNQSSDDISNDNSEDFSSVNADPLQAVAAAPRGNLCTSKDDCSENQYCSVESGACLNIGECESDADCVDDNNQPFAVALCMGTLECQKGICAMDCGSSHDDDEKAETNNKHDDDSNDQDDSNDDKKDNANKDYLHDSKDHGSSSDDTSVLGESSNSSTPIALEPETQTVTYEAAVLEGDDSGAGSIASTTFAAVAVSSILLLVSLA